MQSPRYHQMTLDDLLDNNITDISKYIDSMSSNTRTHIVDHVNEKKLNSIDVESMISILKEFNQKHSKLFEVDRKALFNTFYIPKRSGGLRRIDAPVGELMEALRQLKFIFESSFFALYHTSAFAYIRGRCTVDAVKKHQQNESKWFVKIDFSNFFGSTTIEFLISQLAIIFPFSEILKNEEGKTQLTQAASLCFFNGGLPQGTPISPLLTNLLMIPIDHKLSNTLRDFNKKSYVYTRYADDIIVSSKYDFEHDKIYKLVVNVLHQFNAPYKLNPQKTRYGSSAGSNWNLGVMLNKDNKITIGHKKKRQFRAMIDSFIRDHLNSIQWDKYDVQVLSGYINYYSMIEKSEIDSILNGYSSKYKIDIRSVIKAKLK